MVADDDHLVLNMTFNASVVVPSGYKESGEVHSVAPVCDTSAPDRHCTVVDIIVQGYFAQRWSGAVLNVLIVKSTLPVFEAWALAIKGA